MMMNDGWCMMNMMNMINDEWWMMNNMNDDELWMNDDE